MPAPGSTKRKRTYPFVRYTTSPAMLLHCLKVAAARNVTDQSTFETRTWRRAHEMVDSSFGIGGGPRGLGAVGPTDTTGCGPTERRGTLDIFRGDAGQRFA